MPLRTIYFISFCFLITCCNNTEKVIAEFEEEEVYVIKEVIINSNEVDPISGEEIIDLGPVFYLDYNIILIDTIPNFYYHKQEYFCFTGYPQNNNLPYFVNLQPENFHQNEGVRGIVNIILNDSTRTEQVYIAYNKDTITDYSAVLILQYHHPTLLYKYS